MKCECCNKPTNYIVNHHWWEKDDSMHTRQVCSECNRALALGTHLLPPWEWQVQMVKTYYQLRDSNTRTYAVRILDQTYTITAYNHTKACRQAAHIYKQTINTPYNVEFLTLLATSHTLRPPQQ